MTDDLLLLHVPHERRVLQLALYAIHLATGNGIWCKMLRSGTIKAYLYDVAKFLMRFVERDPRYAQPNDKTFAPEITAVIKEVERLEDIESKCDPWTLECQDYLRKWALDAPKDGDLCALRDWFMCGLHGGFRLSEWAQYEKRKKFGKHAVYKKRGNTKVAFAFCLCDVTFLEAGGAVIRHPEAAKNPELVKQIKLKWTHQKNGDHGEVKLFVRHEIIDDKCFVASMMSIVLRFRRLCQRECGKIRDDIPLSIYLNKDNKVLNITDQLITRIMRRCAIKVYKLDPKTDKIKLSSHSLRVGACVILHAMGFTGEQIKFLLRWRSDAFMKYLRNIAILSMKQNKAIDTMSRMMPNSSM